MVDESTSGGRSRVLAWTVTLVIFIPIFYVLSTGPVLWLLEKTKSFNPFRIEICVIIYAPVTWLYEHYVWFQIFMNAYLRLFAV